MRIQFQFILILIGLLSGMIAIILANRLMKKYPLSYLSSYFYFLVFNYIFSVYSVIGAQSLKFLLINQNSSPSSIQSTEAILIAMGIPFLILSWYMLIRMSRELFQQEISKFFMVLYFSLFVFSFIAYAALNIDIGGFEAINFFMDRKQLLWTYSGLMITAYGIALIYIFTKRKSVSDINQRKAYSWFGIWNIIIVALMITFLQLSYFSVFFGMGYIVVLTGFHLLPVLFLSIYIQRYFVPIVESPSFDEGLQKIKKHFDISRREIEIITLICKGMSNQEISDSLYISLQTVKDHVYRIFIKTGVKNRVQLANLVSSSL